MKKNKEELCKLRLESVRYNLTPEWTMKEFEQVLKHLKTINQETS